MAGTSYNELDFMYEQESERKWEELNTPTDGETLRQAAKDLHYAINDLDSACDNVNAAAEQLVDTPEGDRVAGLLKLMEDILSDLQKMEKDWTGGELVW